MSGRLRAGTAKIDITAPFTVPYLGYVPRQAYFEGVHDRLHARALYLERDGQAAAIVSLDMIGVSKNLPGGDLRRRVLERVGGRLNLTARRAAVLRVALALDTGACGNYLAAPPGRSPRLVERPCRRSG